MRMPEQKLNKKNVRSMKNVRRLIFASLIVLLAVLIRACAPVPEEENGSNAKVSFYPSDKSAQVNPDVKLEITFPTSPLLGKSGKIRIYDASHNKLVDMLDLSIPPGPKNYRAPAPYDSIKYESEEKYIRENTMDNGRVFVRVPLEDIYHKKYLGGKLESDVYHFYPVLINDNTATINLHSSALEYNKSYYVLVDPGVLSFSDSSEFKILEKTAWTFTTKKNPPSLEKNLFIVSRDGKGDFNTIQGALEYMPEKNPTRKTIFIKNGRYEEIVYFRNKENLNIIGEDREHVMVCYANNGFFNPRPTGERAEMIKRFRNRRAIFSIHNSNGIHLANLSIQSLGERPAQAEGLLVIGEQNIVNKLTIIGSGDALQATGTIYMSNSSVTGFGDNVLGYGAVFFKECDMVSTYGPHLWVRNTHENHGNVFVNSTFSTIGDVETVFARAPSSPNYSFPFVEAVMLNCTIEGIRAEGWGKVAEKTDDIRYWEYNSTRLSDGQPVDVSQRHPASRQLAMPEDSAIIANYSRPEYILEDWSPEMAPVIAAQSEEVKAAKGQSVTIVVDVLAIPEAEYQWMKDDKPVKGATSMSLTIETLKKMHEGYYTLQAENNSGAATSNPIHLKVK